MVLSGTKWAVRESPAVARAVDLGLEGANRRRRDWSANRRRLQAKYGARAQSAAALAHARRRASAPPQELALARPLGKGDLEVDGSSKIWTTRDTNP